MRFLSMIVMGMTGLSSLSAFGQAPPVDPNRSLAEPPAPMVRHVYESPINLSLNLGYFSYEQPDLTNASRFTTALVFDWNFSPAGPVPTPIQYGLESGLSFSYLGSAGAQFFGTGGRGTSSASLFVIPVDLWGGYHWARPNMIFGVHTGANLYLVTDEAAIDLGRQTDGVGGAAQIYPDLGFNIGWDTGQNFAVTFRTDWTLSPDNANFTGMLGATIPLA